MPGPAWSWGLLLGFLAASLAPCPASAFSSPAFTKTRLNCIPRRTESKALSMSAEPEGVGRRALIAATLGPLASVVTAYAVLPLVLGPEVRKKEFYQENFASRMGEMQDYEAGILPVKKSLFSIIDPGDDVIDLGFLPLALILNQRDSPQFCEEKGGQKSHKNLKTCSRHRYTIAQMAPSMLRAPAGEREKEGERERGGVSLLQQAMSCCTAPQPPSA